MNASTAKPFSTMSLPAFRRAPIGLALSALVAAGPGLAAPQGGVVTSGSATILQSGSVTNINQGSQKAAINWQSFSTAPSETVNFNQPNSSAITLNRVIGNERSVLEGAINAIGKVFLLNSNGVLIGKTAAINTGSFLATTLNISDEDFNAGNYVFRSSGSRGSIINMGTINAAEGGYVALLGDSVSNQGVISATKGTVVLSSGNRITLNFNGDSLLGVTIDEGALNALVENRQAIYADGGKVILTAKAADELLGSQVNNTGLIRARTLDDLTGNIELYAHGGTTNIDGTLDASAPTSGNGGFVETSGDHVKIADTAQILTHSAHGANGSWLIDPVDFTIAASGGDMTGAFLSNFLNNQGSQTILSSAGGSGTSGNINVNDEIIWNSGNSLTFTANHDININRAVTASGADASVMLNAGHDINFNAALSMSGERAALSMNYGADYHINNMLVAANGAIYTSATAITLSGADATLEINGTPYLLIHSMGQLAGISAPIIDAGTGEIQVSDWDGTLMFSAAAGNYALAQDLDAGNTIYPYAVVNALTGNLHGLGHKINNLKVAVTNEHPNEVAALIGTFGPAILRDEWGMVLKDPITGEAILPDVIPVLRDIGLSSVNISASGDAYSAAGLVSTNHYGTIRNTYVTGSITGNQPVAGLVGSNVYGHIVDSHTDVSISALAAGSNVGGLVGQNWGTIERSSAKGTIDVAGIEYEDGSLTQSAWIGGLVGSNYAGNIVDAHSNVNITARNSILIGGLVGENLVGTISNSTASGNITVTWTNAMVYGYSYGGLVGENAGGVIENSTASGNVTASTTGYPVREIGGLVGTNTTGLKILGEDIFWVTGTVNNSSSSGNVTTNGMAWDIGGAVGMNYGSISNVTTSGNVNGNADSMGVGGLVGSNYGDVYNSSASGNVGGGMQVGGLAGINGGTIDHSNASGSVTGVHGESGGLVGREGGTTINSTYRDAPAEAAARAFQEARGNDAANLGSNLGQTATLLPTLPNGSNTLTSPPPSLSNRITFAAQNFSADIQSITVDGVTFNLEQAPGSNKEGGNSTTQ